MQKKIKKTKIVVTIGPACSSKEKIEELLKAGATMFRINTSHGKVDEHKDVIKTIREVAKKMNCWTPILVDLQGPKIRVGNLENPIELQDGEEVIITPSTENKSSGVVIPVDYDGIVQDVKIGDKMLMDDGKIVLEATFVDSVNNFLKAKVIHGNLLKSRKGLNIPGATTSIDVVTARDIEFIKFAVENDIDYLALSFVRNREDILTAKKYLKVFGKEIPVIAKIEKPQAVENIDEIIEVSDGIMVARGDLGIELSPENVPIVQKMIIEKCNLQRKVVIVATQMLESMIDEPIPTRAEASDVANAILDGTDAIMLSGETSVGKFPVEAVKMMSNIAEKVEESVFCKYNSNLFVTDNYEYHSQAIVSSTVKMSKDIKVEAIVAFTHTGYTTKLLAKDRPQVPVIAISDMETTCRRLNLYWNVSTYFYDYDGAISKDVIKEFDNFLIKKAGFQLGDKIIITGSVPKLISGRTNFILVHIIGEVIDN